MANNPLQTFGTMSFNDIRIELAVPTQSPFGLDEAENGTYAVINQCSPQKPSAANPAQVLEWYGYNHIATASVFLTNTEGPSATSAGACALANANQWTLYVAGAVYYQESTCLTPLDQYYRDDGGFNWYQFSGGAFVAQGACTATTTTTTTTLACACNFKTFLCTSGCANAGFGCTDNIDCS